MPALWPCRHTHRRHHPLIRACPQNECMHAQASQHPTPPSSTAASASPTPIPEASSGAAPLALLSALPPELHALLPHLEDAAQWQVAGRTVHTGRLLGRPVVMALCGIGKVSAALTTTLLLERFGARALLFTGVAGGVGADTRVGDVVVARELLQHDLDCSPLFPRHHIPELQRERLTTDAGLSRALLDAAQAALQPGATAHAALLAFGVQQARLHHGLVISGDRFVATAPESQSLAQRLPEALAVEMEGAAMAQVCAAYNVPCAVLRTVSDKADDQAGIDFPRFLQEVASPLSRDIVLGALQRRAPA